MSPKISERSFEESIECGLLRFGPDACADTGAVRETDAPYGEDVPGGYHKRTDADYDRTLCLVKQDALAFVLATQPRVWKQWQQHHGAAASEQFLKRLSSELATRGTLDVLRHGIKEAGCRFSLAYFRPASGLNEEIKRLYGANIFAIARQVHYSLANANCLDLVLFINGIPIFTAELKNPLNGQDVEDAIRQYKTDRDPREPLLTPGRCLAHFAVDPDLVFVTTKLARASTLFLPFNQGKFGGAGNPPVTPTRRGYATAYLWEETWSRDSVLELIRRFIHEVTPENGNGSKRFLIFPRYQQLDAVRRLVRDARMRDPGQRYLIQHSAGSGKSFTIAWLAHQLATLHNVQDRRVFDSIIVITDRRVLDRQLQATMHQFEQVLGVVENIDETSRQLKAALEAGKTIIVTTLQKFPVIVNQMGELPGKTFAVIVDEAHSSQSGESTKSLKEVLAYESLEDAEIREVPDQSAEEELEDEIVAQMKLRGPLPNVSMFAFTATPKPKTMELFGQRRADGKFEPFHLYSMRQAIEEGFILDVLANYTTYTAYWRLLKTIADDPRYDKRKAQALLVSFVELHPHAINEKVRIMVEHFATQSQDKIGGKAKAMIVTRSRLHAVRYKLAIDRYFSEKGYPFKALVAFSGTVQDGGKAYTEAGMNGFSERQTAKAFEQPDSRFLIVAAKFQTGFDQPLLHTMYVDKKLGGVNAVQALSRLNRVMPPLKTGTLVLDFANSADEIQKAFEPYYETTLLAEGTDPNLLYQIQGQLFSFPVFTPADVTAFARLFYDAKAGQDQLYSSLAPLVDRFCALGKPEQDELRGQLTDYIRLYAFLAQILTFTDSDLEKLYVFARALRRLIPGERDRLPQEVQQSIDMESYRLQQTGSGKIPLERTNGVIEPQRMGGPHGSGPEELEALSRIIAELNDRFGLNLGEEHRVTLGQIMDRLNSDTALDASARVNTRENVRLTFDQKVENVIQGIVDSNFDLYKRITDDRGFGDAVKNFLFDQYVQRHRQVEDLLKLQESKTLEFKSSLRYGVDGSREMEKEITHAVLKTIAAFLNTEGGDLLIGVADDRTVVGIDHDQLDNDDKFMRHLMQTVRNALGARASTCLDPTTQVVHGKTVCLVSCQRSPEPVFLRWKGIEASPDGDFYVRSGPGTVRLKAPDVDAYVKTRFVP